MGLQPALHLWVCSIFIFLHFSLIKQLRLLVCFPYLFPFPQSISHGLHSVHWLTAGNFPWLQLTFWSFALQLTDSSSILRPLGCNCPVLVLQGFPPKSSKCSTCLHRNLMPGFLEPGQLHPVRDQSCHGPHLQSTKNKVRVVNVD